MYTKFMWGFEKSLVGSTKIRRQKNTETDLTGQIVRIREEFGRITVSGQFLTVS